MYHQLVIDFSNCYQFSNIQIVCFFSESFLESVPQCLILSTLRIYDPEIFYIEYSITPMEGFSQYAFGWIAFVTSAYSSVFGMAKFLKSGPCRLIPNEGPLGGFTTGSFLLLFLTTLVMVFVKIFSCLYIMLITYNPLQIILSFVLNCGIPFLYVSI